MRPSHQPASRQPYTIIEPARGWLRISWSELWGYREVLVQLALRDIRVRYKQTVLGAAWAILQPVVAMVVFSVVFGRFLGVQERVQDLGVPYPFFVYAGILPWTFFSSTVNDAGISLVNNMQLFTKVYFPRLHVPLSVLGYTLLDLCLASVVLVGMMLYYDIPLGPSLALLPLVVLAIAACAIGCGAMLAALTVKYRDFRFVIPFLLQIWLFATPVIYPSSVIPPQYQALASLNPMTGLVTSFRACLLSTPLDAGHLAISAAVGLVVLVAGVSYFRQVEDRLVDIA